jgi:ABC-type sugar transport system substrate-binding protein
MGPVQRWAIAVVAGFTALVVGCGAEAERAPVRVAAQASEPVSVGVVLNYLDDPFFVALYEGVQAEARRLGVRATVRSITSNAELADQADQLRALAAEGHDCYVVNPVTATNLVGALRAIRRPIVNVDSPIDGAAARRAGVRVRAYIGTDDLTSGRRAGAEMAALLPDGGEVAILGGIADNVNSGIRMRGFQRGISGSRVRVVARVNADYDRTKAQIAAARILREHPRLDGFFAVSDSMVLGVVDALRGLGRTGTIKVVGHDGTPEALAHLRAGAISADVSQYPYVMGRMAVEACVAAARGATLPERVDAPITLLTRGNVARAIAAFPKPVERYSDPLSRLIQG